MGNIILKFNMKKDMSFKKRKVFLNSMLEYLVKCFKVTKKDIRYFIGVKTIQFGFRIKFNNVSRNLIAQATENMFNISYFDDVLNIEVLTLGLNGSDRYMIEIEKYKDRMHIVESDFYNNNTQLTG